MLFLETGNIIHSQLRSKPTEAVGLSGYIRLTYYKLGTQVYKVCNEVCKFPKKRRILFKIRSFLWCLIRYLWDDTSVVLIRINSSIQVCSVSADWKLVVNLWSCDQNELFRTVLDQYSSVMSANQYTTVRKTHGNEMKTSQTREWSACNRPHRRIPALFRLTSYMT